MRVLHIINSLQIGGAEKLLVDLVPLLNRQPYEVAVLLIDGQDSFLLKQLRQTGVMVHTLGKNHNIYNPILVFGLIKYIRKYDIIHSHLFPTQYWTALASLFVFPRKILITTEHSTDNRRRNISWMYPADRFIYRNYNKIIAISAQTYQALASYLKSNDNIITIENGVNIASYQSGYKIRNLSNPLFVITQIAGFRIEKDQKTLIRTMKNLPDYFHLWLVGLGTEINACKQLVEDLHLSHRVDFLGIRDDVPDILQKSDVVVMSSHWEGFGLAAVEGMAAGKPVVASDVPGLREVVEGAGVLFGAGQTHELAAILKELHDDHVYYEKTADLCKARALQYDVGNMAERYLSLYQELYDN